MKLFCVTRFCGLALLLLACGDAMAEPGFYHASEWNRFGRGEVQTNSDGVTIKDCFLASKRSFEDGRISIHARAPHDAAQAQIWAGFRCKDRDHRYVVALRGGNN